MVGMTSGNNDCVDFDVSLSMDEISLCDNTNEKPWLSSSF